MVPPPPKGGEKVADVLARFRTGQSKVAKVLADGAKERDERVKKIQNGGVSKKPAVPRKTKSRAAKSTTSSGPAPSDAPSADAAAAAPVDWRKAVAAAPKPTLPLGMRQKQVLDFLRNCEEPATIAEITTATGRDVSAETDLAAALSANPKIAIDQEAGTYAYQPEANVRDKQQVLDHVRKNGAPVLVSELADAYRGVMSDIAALKQQGVVLGLHSFDPDVNCEVLYPVDQKLTGLEVDDDVRALWLATDVPDEDVDVAVELRGIGVEPVARKAPRTRPAGEKKKRKKPRKATKLRSVTNVHLMHLLEGDAPAALDALPPTD